MLRVIYHRSPSEHPSIGNIDDGSHLQQSAYGYVASNTGCSWPTTILPQNNPLDRIDIFPLSNSPNVLTIFRVVYRQILLRQQADRVARFLIYYPVVCLFDKLEDWCVCESNWLNHPPPPLYLVIQHSSSDRIHSNDLWMCAVRWLRAIKKLVCVSILRQIWLLFEL